MAQGHELKGGTMYELPPAPQAPTQVDHRPLYIGAAVTVVIIIGLLAANLMRSTPTAFIAPSPAVPTVAPSPATIQPAPVTDPMDATMQQLHEDIYVQQFCNMADTSGIPFFARAIDLGAPWKVNSIGSAWVAAQNRTGFSVTKLATEFYGRYC